MKKYMSAAAAAVFSLSVVQAFGQDLNPTVEVTNSYSGKAIEAHKPMQKMAVPDSLRKFDLDFSYSVLSNPYKGGYDFSPYLLDMRPDKNAYKGHKLYFRAGAGYTLNPELDFVYSPVLRNNSLKLNVFAYNRSYIGDYAAISAKQDGDGYVLKKDGDAGYSGRDMLTKAGVGGRYDWKRTSVDFGAAYYGIHTKDFSLTSNYNAADIFAGIHSSPAMEKESYFFYNAELSYRAASDGSTVHAELPRSAGPSMKNSLKTNDFSFKAELGPVLDFRRRVSVEAGTDLTTYSDLFSGQKGHFYVTPRYVRSGGTVNFQAGVKFDFALKSGDRFKGIRSGHVFYPDVKFDARLIEDRLDFYASAVGGIDSNGYADMKSGRHFFNSVYAGSPLFSDNTIEQINVSAGFRGNFASVFRYDISAGYASLEGMALDNVMIASPVSLPGIVYEDTELIYARLKYVLETRSILIDGSVGAVNSKLYDDGKAGIAPAPVSGDIRVKYNWNRRIYAGVYAAASAQRKGWAEVYGTDARHEVKVPGYVDLGVEGEYAFKKNFSLWISARNLLGANVQRSPLYVEKGVKLTAGVCINL